MTQSIATPEPGCPDPKITRIEFQRIFFELDFWNFLCVVVQIRDHFISAVRDSDTRVIIVFVHRHDFILNSNCISLNCENFEVFFVMKHCPISTTFRNPASIKNLLNLSCCDNFSIRSRYFCKRRCLRARSSLSKGISVLITFRTNEELECHHDGLRRSIVKGFVFFTHFCDCSVRMS